MELAPPSTLIRARKRRLRFGTSFRSGGHHVQDHALFRVTQEIKGVPGVLWASAVHPGVRALSRDCCTYLKWTS